jgi:hypothetical protein
MAFLFQLSVKFITLNKDEGKEERRKIDMGASWAKWDYRDTSEIMSEINALTPSYGDITHARLLKGERRNSRVRLSTIPALRSCI